MSKDSSEATNSEERPALDRVSAVLTVFVLAALASFLWLRFGPPGAPEPPGVGKMIPALKLLDVETSEPLVLLGLRGKVVWITFWSASSPTGPADLAALESVWKRLHPHTMFAMAAAASESDRPAIVRAAVAAAKAEVPSYLASPETLRAFGATAGDLPLHVLLDPNGRVAAVARGRDPITINRLADQADRALRVIDPLGASRFALK
jgi:hypothetical protein